MGSPIFYLLMLVIPFHVSDCYLNESAVGTIQQGTGLASTFSNMLPHLLENITTSIFDNELLPNHIAVKRNIYKHSLADTSTDGYFSSTENQTEQSHNPNQQNLSVYMMSSTDRESASWLRRWTWSPLLASLLPHLPFQSFYDPGRTQYIKHDHQQGKRDQRSVASISGSYNTHSNTIEYPMVNHSTNSQFISPHFTVPSLAEPSNKHPHIILNGNAATDITHAAQPAGGKLEYNQTAPWNTLYIGGLFELSGKYAEKGYSELAAALLAISHINSQGFIPGYQLKLLYNDSKCDPGVGTDAFFDFIYRKSKHTSLIMVMGSACAEVTKTIAEIVPYWDLILISYAATSPALSEREKYRTFFRLALGDSALNPARRMLIKHFLWDKVAALYEDLESMSLAFNGINKDFSAHGIVIKFSTSFKDAAIELPGQLKDMKDLDVRILIGGFSEDTARQVFCEAYKHGMYGPRYVWILVGGLKRQWWKDVRENSSQCSQSQLAAAVEGAFTVIDFNGLLEGSTSFTNPTSSMFLDEYLRANGSLPLSTYATNSYDTVWTMAFTVRHALEKWAENGTVPLLHQLRYEDMKTVKETFISTMENLEFNGVSGPVSFKGSDREGIAVVYQIQGGNFTQVAFHQPANTSLDFECESCSRILWRDGRVPKDEQVVVPRLKTIEKFVFYTSTSLCVGGIVLAVVFLSYNLYHGRLKFIKLSSPKLNNVAVIGCILVYAAVIIMGLDDRVLTEESFPIVCSGRAFLLAAGFSLAFGAMFAKTFRVHQIFTRTHHGLVKSKLIQDTHLLVIIGVLLAVDSVMVVAWVIVDPMSRKVTNITKQVSAEDEDLIFQEQLATCHSSHLQKWLGAFYAYKGLLLVFGVYMAWETRHVKIPALNDSRYIGLNVYNVVIMSVSVVVISNILSSQPTLVYAMEAAFMLLSTTVTLCLLFVPKIYVIVTSGGNPVIASMGIVVDNSNTRRFVFDDRKEIYYRAEVQNRVYKRELVELDQQIVRLERLLEIPLQPYPMLTEELLYLLPESKVDGTPLCHRRYKRELERCNSISDGGEGVVFDISENDDMLLEMNFTSLNPKPLTNKRHSAVETSKNSPSTLQKLTRSLSIGGSGRGRKRKKGRALLKSPLPFRSSESHFMSKVNHVDVLRNNHLAVNRGNPNRYSDDLTYLYSEKSNKYATSGVDFRKNKLICRYDKVTQTSNESLSKRQYCIVGSGANGRKGTDVDLCIARGEREGSSREGHLICDTSNYIRPQLLTSKQEKMFAVNKIQIQAVDDDSNSDNNDNENGDDRRLGYFSNDSARGYIRLRPEDLQDQIFGVNSYGSTPALKTVAQDNEVTPSWFVENMCLSIPPGYHSNTSSNSSVYDAQLSQQTLNIDSLCRPRSVSTPNKPTSTSLLHSFEASSSQVHATPNTTNITSPLLRSPVHHPVCLSHRHIEPHKSSEHIISHNVNINTVERQHSNCQNQDHALKQDNMPQPSKGDNWDKSNPSLLSPHIHYTFPDTTFNAKENMKSSPSLLPQDSFSVHSEVLSKPVFMSLRQGSLSPLQIYPYEQTSQTSTVLRKSVETIPTSSTGVDGSESRAYSLTVPQSSSCLKFNSVKKVLQAERRRKIQKLQDDLVKIQQELQDLNDLEFDVSEV